MSAADSFPTRCLPMKLPVLMLYAGLCLLLPAAAAIAVDTPETAAAEPVKVPSRGYLCVKTKPVPASGETHGCYFVPDVVGSHDFSARNARVLQVITELGPHCNDVEILDETAHPAANGGKELRRVSVACLR